MVTNINLLHFKTGVRKIVDTDCKNPANVEYANKYIYTYKAHKEYIHVNIDTKRYNIYKKGYIEIQKNIILCILLKLL